MNDYLQLVESIQREEASIARIFDGEGVNVRQRSQAPHYQARLAEATAFLASILDGRRPAHYLREVMTTSDFPYLFGDILDRQVLAHYQTWPTIWPQIAKRGTVRDFRQAKLFPPAYGADLRLSKVPEVTAYPEAVLTEQAPLTRQVHKWGRRVPLSWEAIVNDDLDQLKDLPRRLGVAAGRTEDREITDLVAQSTGPHSSLYTVGNDNIINTTNHASQDNPPLSIKGLQDGMIVLANQVDEEGEPIMIDAVVLMVPPSLEIPARNILNATEIQVTQAGGVPDVHRTDSSPSATGEQRLVTQNWMRSRVQLVVNPYLPLVDTTSGHTAWYLFASPQTGRPALQLDFLRGYETPQVLIKSPNAVLPGGGLADPMGGDFDTDTVQYRVRHVLGALQIDGKATVASNGTGS